MLKKRHARRGLPAGDGVNWRAACEIELFQRYPPGPIRFHRPDGVERNSKVRFHQCEQVVPRHHAVSGCFEDANALKRASASAGLR